jgi:AcrR family transcriptional regulator
MSGVDRRTRRREQTRQEILDAAWAVAREHGLAGLTMRDLGARVGMRAQSLYAYFPSKHAIYDAMFAQGNRELLGRYRAMVDEGAPRDPRSLLRRCAELYVQFCAEDPTRQQLLYQRPVPGFEPRPESYAIAVDGLALLRGLVHDCGVTTSRQFDLWTALISGLAAQQNANEPGGTRWLRLLDEAVDMFLLHLRRGGRP